MLTRRNLFGGLASFKPISNSLVDEMLPADEWQLFKARFLSDNGRIIDNGNNGVSHSEGQGWGLLFAVAAQDQASFNLILSWTTHALRRPNDALHAWRYVPNEEPSVPDLNNAADGDLFIAAALIQANRLWGRRDHLLAAATIGRDILRLLVRRVGPFTVLLPGIQGFETQDAIIINPSYYAFPMLTALAGLVPSQQWGPLQRDGRALIEHGRFGRWALPADWLRINKASGDLSLAPGWPPRFSFDAVRVPLWWLWQRMPAGLAIQAVEQFWSASPSHTAPAWVNLETDKVAPYPATPGMMAIMRLIRLATGSSDEPGAPSVANAMNYYDASLILLARIAEREIMSH